LEESFLVEFLTIQVEMTPDERILGFYWVGFDSAGVSKLSDGLEFFLENVFDFGKVPVIKPYCNVEF
jgi:hypothetical protein